MYLRDVVGRFVNRVTVKLVECKLRQCPYWAFVFHRNLLGVVYSHIGQDRIGVIPVGGVLDKRKQIQYGRVVGWRLEHLAGDHVAAMKWLDGDDPVQYIAVSYGLSRLERIVGIVKTIAILIWATLRGEKIE